MLLPGIKAALCTNIRVLIREMGVEKVDNRHVPKRNLNSMLLHVNTTHLMDAEDDDLWAFYQHLRERNHEG